MKEVAGPLELAPADWHGYPHTLADVLPAVAGALGVASEGAGPVVPPSESVVLLLIDGLGATLLEIGRASCRERV